MLDLKEHLEKILDDIANLEDGWDGEDAHSVSLEIVDNAKDMIIEFEIEPEISPCANGTISFEWNNEYYNAYMEIGKDTFIFYIYEKGYESSNHISIITVNSRLFYPMMYNHLINMYFHE